MAGAAFWADYEPPPVVFHKTIIKDGGVSRLDYHGYRVYYVRRTTVSYEGAGLALPRDKDDRWLCTASGKAERIGKMLLAGHCNREIIAALGVARKTVSKVRRLMRLLRGWTPPLRKRRPPPRKPKMGVPDGLSCRCGKPLRHVGNCPAVAQRQQVRDLLLTGMSVRAVRAKGYGFGMVKKIRLQLVSEGRLRGKSHA